MELTNVDYFHSSDSQIMKVGRARIDQRLMTLFQEQKMID